MLKGIEIEDFTNFRQTKIEFAENVNIIFGDSGCGKSNILKLIDAFVHCKCNSIPVKFIVDVSDMLKYIFDVKGLTDLICNDALDAHKNFAKFTFENSEFNSGFTIVNNEAVYEFKEVESIYDVDNVVFIGLRVKPRPSGRGCKRFLLTHLLQS